MYGRCMTKRSVQTQHWPYIGGVSAGHGPNLISHTDKNRKCKVRLYEGAASNYTWLIRGLCMSCNRRSFLVFCSELRNKALLTKIQLCNDFCQIVLNFEKRFKLSSFIIRRSISMNHVPLITSDNIPKIGNFE